MPARIPGVLAMVAAAPLVPGAAPAARDETPTFMKEVAPIFPELGDADPGGIRTAESFPIRK